MRAAVFKIIFSSVTELPPTKPPQKEYVCTVTYKYHII